MLRRLLHSLPFFFIAGLLPQPFLTAQPVDPHSILREYSLHTIHVSEGAPTNINTLAQTPDGFLWLGADKGVFRFDGVKFQSAGSDTMTVNDRCQSMAVLQDSSLLCGFNTGVLMQYTSGSARLFQPPSDVGEKAIGALLQLSDGTILIGTSGAGLFILRDGTLDNITTEDGLPSNVITALSEAVGGPVWVGTEDGLARLDPGTPDVIRTVDGISHHHILSLFHDSKGSLWIGTHRGLDVMEAGRIIQVASNILQPVAGIYSITEDPSGDIWFAVDGAGLFRICHSASGIQRITDQDGLPGNLLRCVFVDREGTIWAAQGANFGITQLQRQVVRLYTKADGLSTENILAMYPGASGQTWVGAADGNMDSYTGGTFTSHTASLNFGCKPIFTITEDAGGNLWVGGEDSLVLYNGRSRSGSVTFHFHDQVSYRALFTAINGDIWVGTDMGILRIRGKDTLSVGEEEGLTDNRAFCFAEDAEGGIWIGTPEGGVNRYHQGIVTHFSTGNGLSSDCILCLYIDGDGIVWAGTASGGLNRIDPATGDILSFGKDEGLDYVITQIEEDTFGYLWIGSEIGVISVEKRSLHGYPVEGKTVEREVYSCFEYGLPANLNAAVFPSSCKLNDGHIWFPSNLGIVAIDPGRAHKPVPFPVVVIERVIVNSNPQTLQSAYTLPPGVIHMEVSFTAPGFISPESIRFRYRLVGYDDDWVVYGNERKAHYTKIPFGKYTFQVQCTNYIGNWSDQTLSIPIRIRPYFYQQIWFIVLCLFLGVFILYALVRYRIRYIRERELEVLVDKRTAELRELNRELDRRVLDRTAELAAANQELEAFTYSVSHDLRAPVRRIEGLVEALREDHASQLDDSATDLLAKVSDSSIEMGRLIEEFLKLARIARQEIDKTELDLSSLATEILEEISSAEPDRKVSINIAPDLMAHGDPSLIRIALLNLLNNAWKYTGKTQNPEIAFYCEESPGQRVYVIRDNGVGFDMSHYDKLFTPFLRLHSDDQFSGTGIGLATVKRIILKHGGKIWARSEPGNGCTFFFTL